MQPDELRRRVVTDILPRVQTPGQYLAGELNAVAKDHAAVRGRLCLAFPDAYTIGMSHHGLQVLYHLMNRRDDWLCERVFTPMPDMEALLREQGLPLYGLESFTPLGQFDVVGFSLQYELCATNVLTMLDLAGIPLHAAQRTLDHPLVIAGGPVVANPEPMAALIDLFALGDGEEALPAICDGWIKHRDSAGNRTEALKRMAAELPFAYVPAVHGDGPSIDSFEPRPSGCGDDSLASNVQPPASNIPIITPAVVSDLETVPLPTRPIVPYIECVQDRITLEIMRGCPGRCRFCQSRPLKHPIRFRSVETLIAAAIESYHNTGYNEIGLLSLSTSDYPYFDELLRRLFAEFRPRGVSISVPSLRVNEQWRTVAEKLNTDRRSGLTLAPEAARDELRRHIGKRLSNDDLLAGCRRAFECGFHRVKLYFMCGLPGECEADIDGIIELSTEIARLGRDVIGRWPTVVANVSNFVPKPQTPFQDEPMRRRDYFEQVHHRLRSTKKPRAVQVKIHDLETSLIEAVLARGDRRLSQAIEQAWRAGARMDAWNDRFQPALWWNAFEQCGIDTESILHQCRGADDARPWRHIAVNR